MFSFQPQDDHRLIEQFLRRVTDLTSPNRPPLDGESRAESRFNRTFPVVLALWEDDRPIPADATIALTKDISDSGMALVLHGPFRADQVVIGIWVEPRLQGGGWGGEPKFAIGDIRQNVALGGGYWQLGVELSRVMTASETPKLRSLLTQIAHLIPGRPNDEEQLAVQQLR